MALMETVEACTVQSMAANRVSWVSLEDIRDLMSREQIGYVVDREGQVRHRGRRPASSPVCHLFLELYLSNWQLCLGLFPPLLLKGKSQAEGDPSSCCWRWDATVGLPWDLNNPLVCFTLNVVGTDEGPEVLMYWRGGGGVASIFAPQSTNVSILKSE